MFFIAVICVALKFVITRFLQAAECLAQLNFVVIKSGPTEFVIE